VRQSSTAFPGKAGVLHPLNCPVSMSAPIALIFIFRESRAYKTYLRPNPVPDKPIVRPERAADWSL